MRRCLSPLRAKAVLCDTPFASYAPLRGLPRLMRPTFGSLFAGIGGIDLGLERAGWECLWQCEKDPYCRRVLAKHWPHVPCYPDATALPFSSVPRVDMLAGGFPCQPWSLAGKQLGTSDERYLWPAFREAIRVLQPRYVFV